MSTWSPQLVENLLFRQYMKGEDVSGSIPPTPQPTEISDFMAQYEASAKMMLAFVKHVPGSALAPTSSNVIAAASSKPIGSQPAQRAAGAANTAPSTPVPKTPVNKQQGGSNVDVKSMQAAALVNAVNAVAAAAAGANGALPPRTPKAKSDSPAPKRERPNGEVSANSTPKNKAKKTRVEWPLTVPTNAQLKADKRSAVAHLTTARVKAQDGVDPDLLFAQPLGEFPLQSVFFKYPEAMKSIAAARGLSGDWRNDTFTIEEEDLYKREMVFAHRGPSQCVSGTLKMF